MPSYTREQFHHLDWEAMLKALGISYLAIRKGDPEAEKERERTEEALDLLYGPRIAGWSQLSLRGDQGDLWITNVGFAFNGKAAREHALDGIPQIAWTLGQAWDGDDLSLDRLYEVYIEHCQRKSRGR